MQPSLMDALATAMGNHMTLRLYNQWKAFWKFVFAQIFEVTLKFSGLRRGFVSREKYSTRYGFAVVMVEKSMHYVSKQPDIKTAKNKRSLGGCEPESD